MIAEINATNTVLVTTFGTILNSLAIWMISRHTQQEMRIYSRILLQTCIIDLLSIFMNVLVQPVFFSDGGVGTVWSFGPVHMLPHPWHCLIFLFFVFVQRFSTTSVCSLFAYRYLVVNRNVVMTIQRYAILLATVIIPVGVLVGSSFMANCPTCENERLNNSHISTILGLQNATLQYTVSLRANAKNGSSSFTATLAMAISIGSYLIVIFCGVSIHLRIQHRFKGPSMVARRQMDAQITVVLLTQALLPLLSLLPQLTINGLIRFKYSRAGPLITYVGMFSTVPITWISVLNPLATLLSVRNYRTKIVEAIVSRLCRLHKSRFELRTIPNRLLLCEPKKNTNSSDEMILGKQSEEEEAEEDEGGEILL